MNAAFVEYVEGQLATESAMPNALKSLILTAARAAEVEPLGDGKDGLSVVQRPAN